MAQKHLPHRPGAHQHERGFTLIELLIVIAVVGILMGIMLPAMAAARLAASRVRELSAAGQLMTAFVLYADDARGTLLPGYLPASMVSSSPTSQPQVEVYDDQGERIFGVRAQRYPWRIAPYLADDMAALYKDPALLQRYRQRSDYQYVVSLSPSLGMNTNFVGGKASPGFGFNPQAAAAWGPFYVTRIDQPLRPERLIVFASARGVDPDGGAAVPGFYSIEPPFLTARQWAPRYRDDAPPESFGNIHARYAGHAVITCFDAHAETVSPDTLDDMTRWANRATRPDWTLGDR